MGGGAGDGCRAGSRHIHRIGNGHGTGNGHGFLRWHAGGNIKRGRETVGASNRRWVRTWKSASVGHSQQLYTMAAVQLGIAPSYCGQEIVGGVFFFFFSFKLFNNRLLN